MTKIIQFKQENVEECKCLYCELIWENIGAIADSESYEDLFENLSKLVAEVKHEAVAEYLANEIDFKISQFEAMTGVCTCDECDCKDGCELEE